MIVSRAGGANWLSTDPSEGKLVTELEESGRGGRTLVSQAIITDGHWHRVGLTWDGSNRILYVDDIEVAKRAQGGFAGSTGVLYIGAEKNLEPGRFWSGLVDDVRIYNRAISP